jgi:hypothetical protein
MFFEIFEIFCIKSLKASLFREALRKKNKERKKMKNKSRNSNTKDLSEFMGLIRLIH